MRKFIGVLAIATALAALCSGCGTEELTCGGGESLYPLEENAWWRFKVTDSQSGVRLCPDKLVSIGALQEIPLRSDVEAYPALSDQTEKNGIRWQEVMPDGSVRRHVDEWFANDGTRTKIVHYCPYMIRIDDGAHACAGAAWTESWRELEISVVEGAPDPEACASIVVNSGDCSYDQEAVAELAESCVVAAAPNDGMTEKLKSWEVLAVDEAKDAPAGTFASTLHLRTVDDEDGETNWWWARGVGKIAEEASDEDDALLAYCLTAAGCGEPPPTDLDAGCP